MKINIVLKCILTIGFYTMISIKNIIVKILFLSPMRIPVNNYIYSKQ